MANQTTRKRFTPEQVAELLANPYVRHASETTVKFTQHFRELFYKKLDEGQKANDILISLGIDPEVLGERRIKHLCQSIKVYATREAGFSDDYGRPYRRMMEQDKQSMINRIRQLEHELAYTRQEVEFLKKIAKEDMEARVQWESKHHPK